MDGPDRDAIDRDLLSRWRAGDEAAGEQLVGRHFDLLYRFFRARFDDGAPDLVQRTFLGLVQAKDRIPDEVPLRAYLLGIAHRQLLMALRSRMREDARIGPGPASGVAPSPSPSLMAVQREEQRIVLGAMHTLPIDLQVLLGLYYWEDLPVGEIAAVLDVPAGTVKSRLHRAREQLRDAIVERVKNPELAESTVRDLEALARSLGDRLRTP